MKELRNVFIASYKRARALFMLVIDYWKKEEIVSR